MEAVRPMDTLPSLFANPMHVTEFVTGENTPETSHV
jgi:hypothetical protein